MIVMGLKKICGIAFTCIEWKWKELKKFSKAWYHPNKQQGEHKAFKKHKVLK
jgi:hypothetical protein